VSGFGCQIAEDRGQKTDDRGNLVLDYIRGNLFKQDQMVALPFDVFGPDNDLNGKIDYHCFLMVLLIFPTFSLTRSMSIRLIL